jgi:hypothetical protein
MIPGKKEGIAFSHAHQQVGIDQRSLLFRCIWVLIIGEDADSPNLG